MELIEGTYKAYDGKDYYELALNLKTGEKLLVKNAGCTATVLKMAYDFWKLDDKLYSLDTVRVFFLGTDPRVISEKIPKKYHRMVFNNNL